MGEGFFRRLGNETFLAKEETVGPWNPQLQHGGPPIALLLSTIDAETAVPGTEVVKFSVEFLAPLPLGTYRVELRTVRSGKKVSLHEGALIDASGATKLMARVWRMRKSAGAVPEVGVGEARGGDPLTTPVGPMTDFPYAHSVEWRFEQGGFLHPGPALVHGRPLIPLVEDEETSGLGALAILIDSVNGLSQVLPMGEYQFPPVDLMVSLMQIPNPADYITFDAYSRINSDGVGMSRSVISQRQKVLGESLHTLYVEKP